MFSFLLLSSSFSFWQQTLFHRQLTETDSLMSGTLAINKHIAYILRARSLVILKFILCMMVKICISYKKFPNNHSYNNFLLVVMQISDVIQL